jgi:hypothetical protein
MKIMYVEHELFPFYLFFSILILLFGEISFRTFISSQKAFLQKDAKYFTRYKNCSLQKKLSSPNHFL